MPSHPTQVQVQVQVQVQLQAQLQAQAASGRMRSEVPSCATATLRCLRGGDWYGPSGPRSSSGSGAELRGRGRTYLPATGRCSAAAAAPAARQERREAMGEASEGKQRKQRKQRSLLPLLWGRESRSTCMSPTAPAATPPSTRLTPATSPGPAPGLGGMTGRRHPPPRKVAARSAQGSAAPLLPPPLPPLWHSPGQR